MLSTEAPFSIFTDEPPSESATPSPNSCQLAMIRQYEPGWPLQPHYAEAALIRAEPSVIELHFLVEIPDIFLAFSHAELPLRGHWLRAGWARPAALYLACYWASFRIRRAESFSFS